jgi:hypothetical protein
VNLPGRNAVFAVRHKPDDREPLIETEWGVFKDSSGLDREQAFRVMASTLPAPILRLVADFGAAASRTGHAARPAPINHVSYAVIKVGKVRDCFSKSAWSLNIHESILAENTGIVKYIFTKLLIKEMFDFFQCTFPGVIDFFRKRLCLVCNGVL